MATISTTYRDQWIDPFAQIRRAWTRRSGRLLLTVAVTDRNCGAAEIADDELRWFHRHGLRVAHVSFRRDMRHGDRLCWVLAEPLAVQHGVNLRAAFDRGFQAA